MTQANSGNWGPYRSNTRRCLRVAEVTETLNHLIALIGVFANPARFVAGTKTLHHLLPDLDFGWSTLDPRIASEKCRRLRGNPSAPPKGRHPSGCPLRAGQKGAAWAAHETRQLSGRAAGGPTNPLGAELRYVERSQRLRAAQVIP
jgi:hypothetical protein